MLHLLYVHVRTLYNNFCEIFMNKKLIYFVLFGGLWFFMPLNAFAEKQNLEFDSCPYDGFPTIESFEGNSIVVSGYKFNLIRINHMIAFQKMLSLCNASSVIPLYTDWKQAQGLVAAKTTEASLYAINAAKKIDEAKTEKEKEALKQDAMNKATQFANELVPLVATSKAKKEFFVMSYMTISSK